MGDELVTLDLTPPNNVFGPNPVDPPAIPGTTPAGSDRLGVGGSHATRPTGKAEASPYFIRASSASAAMNPTASSFGP